MSSSSSPSVRLLSSPSDASTFAASVAAEAARWAEPRWQFTRRPYSASTVISLRSPLTPLRSYASSLLAVKLFELLSRHFSARSFAHTFGCLDAVQVAQMAPHLSTVYVSGWQCSSTASSTNEPGPDLADYPYDTVPRKVDQLFRAQDFHASKQAERRSRLLKEAELGGAAAVGAASPALPPFVDYYCPIIADGDTGHGGLTSVMRLTKLMVEAGAAAIHFEDQRPGQRRLPQSD